MLVASQNRMPFAGMMKANGTKLKHLLLTCSVFGVQLTPSGWCGAASAAASQAGTCQASCWQQHQSTAGAVGASRRRAQMWT